MKKLATIALLAGATLGFSCVAQAEDFPATPMNHGAPTNLPGETIIPGMTQAMQLVNGVTQPILQPILAPGGDQMQASSQEPMMHHHMMMHHRMMHHHMMMKHHMMMRHHMMMKHHMSKTSM